MYNNLYSRITVSEHTLGRSSSDILRTVGLDRDGGARVVELTTSTGCEIHTSMITQLDNMSKHNYTSTLINTHTHACTHCACLKHTLQVITQQKQYNCEMNRLIIKTAHN